ncbi:MAG: hypothetical protein ACK58U_11935 [Rubrivivax sp.]|jgi:hypothetical protein
MDWLRKGAWSTQPNLRLGRPAFGQGMLKRLEEMGLGYIRETGEPLALLLALELQEHAGHAEGVAALQGPAHLLKDRPVRLGVNRVGTQVAELPPLSTERVGYVKLRQALLTGPDNPATVPTWTLAQSIFSSARADHSGAPCWAPGRSRWRRCPASCQVSSLGIVSSESALGCHEKAGRV